VKRLSSRERLGALVGAVVLVGAGGWFAGAQVHSPADAAAAHTAPEAGPVTVAVGRQSLTATVVANGSVEFASPKPLSLAGSVGTGTTAAAGDQGAEQRVTKAPVAGTVVKEGDVLMTVNGRPVFALRGAVPMYRALGPGASGDDVTQLQKALRRLGSDPGSISGTFRQGTAAAVTDWYRNKGYEAQQPSPDDQQQLGSLEQAVSAAQEALLTMGTSGASGGGNSSAPESSTDKQIKEIQLGSAKKSLDLANAALSTFKASYGTKVPAGEVVFFPKLPVRLDKVTVKAGDAVSGQIGTVTSSDLVVEAVVPATDAELLRHGMAAEVLTDDGKKAQGTVSALGADATSAATTGDGDSAAGESGGTVEATESADATTTDSSAPVQLRISIADPGQLAGEAEASVKVTIKVGASDGEVLTVPLAAIHTSSDGQARVQVQRAGGLTDVHVTVGLSAAGLVEVKPAGGTLKQGDRVVVGK
jgi:peptidoglycan hydrolase-like protein with peptidoglycan-binding domain